MSNVQHGVVKPPNRRDKAMIGSTGPQPRQRPAAHPPNATGHRADPLNSNGPLKRRASPIVPPNKGMKFNVENARMSQPAAVESPGHGAVPIQVGHQVLSAALLKDTAR